jgi:anti-sigma factor RsiW
MKVTRAVILDLAPLYLTGDASPDTRALVDAYLVTDPDLARWLAEHRADTFDVLAATPPFDLEARTLARTKRRLASQRWVFGLGCFFLALSSSVEFTMRNRHLVEYHLIARDHPAAAAVLVSLATVCWIIYWALRRVPR